MLIIHYHHQHQLMLDMLLEDGLTDFKS